MCNKHVCSSGALVALPTWSHTAIFFSPLQSVFWCCVSIRWVTEPSRAEARRPSAAWPICSTAALKITKRKIIASALKKQGGKPGYCKCADSALFCRNSTLFIQLQLHSHSAKGIFQKITHFYTVAYRVTHNTVAHPGHTVHYGVSLIDPNTALLLPLHLLDLKIPVTHIHTEQIQELVIWKSANVSGMYVTQTHPLFWLRELLVFWKGGSWWSQGM